MWKVSSYHWSWINIIHVRSTHNNKRVIHSRVKARELKYTGQLTQATLRLHGFSSQSMLQVFHTDVLSILPRVPEVQRYIIDCCPTNITEDMKENLSLW